MEENFSWMKHLTFYGGKILLTETPCKYTKKFHYNYARHFQKNP
jgi:hypothetical protein